MAAAAPGKVQPQDLSRSISLGHTAVAAWSTQVIDADASSTLHVTELVQGLLKIRGDLTKSHELSRWTPHFLTRRRFRVDISGTWLRSSCFCSGDTVATLLATKSVHSMLADAWLTIRHRS